MCYMGTDSHSVYVHIRLEGSKPICIGCSEKRLATEDLYKAIYVAAQKSLG